MQRYFKCISVRAFITYGAGRDAAVTTFVVAIGGEQVLDVLRRC